MRLIMLVAKDCLNFVGFMGPEAVFAQSTPYETHIPKGKLPRTKMLNGTASNLTHFAKYIKLTAIQETAVGPSVEDIGTAVATLMKQFSSELILQKYHSKGHTTNTEASLTRYYPQVDYRTKDKPTNGTTRLTILGSKIDEVMAKSSSQMKPAQLPKPVYVSGPDGTPLLAYDLAPWEVLGAPPGQQQLRVGGNLIVTPEMFFGASQKLLRIVVNFVQVESVLEREAAAPPAYQPSDKYGGSAAPGTTGAEEEGSPATKTFGAPQTPPSRASSPQGTYHAAQSPNGAADTFRPV
jgi:hypothetical protein